LVFTTKDHVAGLPGDPAVPPRGLPTISFAVTETVTVPRGYLRPMSWGLNISWYVPGVPVVTQLTAGLALGALVPPTPY
jgi:hypothetical protein